MTYLHSLLHSLMTARGARPRPNGGDAMQPVPVRAALYRPGESEPFAFAEVQGWALHPHRKADGNGAPEAPAELVLRVEVPG